MTYPYPNLQRTKPGGPKVYDRMIRAEMAKSPSLNRCSRDAYTMWPWLIMAADSQGRFDAAPRALRNEIYPFRDDVTDAEMRHWLDEYEAVGQIVRWRVGEREYGELVNFHLYHSLRYQAKSRIPKPDEHDVEVALDKPKEHVEHRLPSDVIAALDNALPGRVGPTQRQKCVPWLYGKERYTAQEVVSALEASIGANNPITYAGKILQNRRIEATIEKEKPARKPVEPLPSWEESLHG